ncbi:MAG: hypothetical protein SXU28_10850 [Pseudomonadota bacterium]|nr:hypothetical protein [Pseudomonadota bacterium]
MTFWKPEDDTPDWLVSEYRVALRDAAIASGTVAGFLTLYLNNLDITWWLLALGGLGVLIQILNGSNAMFTYLRNTRDLEKSTGRAMATVVLALTIGAMAGALLVALIRGWIF